MAKQSRYPQRAALLIVGAVLAAAIVAIPAHAQPPAVPQAFFGAVEVNGQPAAAGARVEARGAGVKTGIVGNPLNVTVAGRYGGPTRFEPRLGVQGSLADGALIEFYVDGVRAECARPGGSWQSTFPFVSGVVTELNLRVGQSATPTATPTSTSAPTAISASPTRGPTNTPEPTWTPAPAAPTAGAAAQITTPATPTPGNIAPTAVRATGAANATPTLQVARPDPPSATPNAAGSASLVPSSPTPTRTAAGKEAAAAAPATPEPPKPGGAATALASATQAASTRPPATLVARVTGAPRGTSTPILGSGALADTAPAAGAAAATSRAMSSILPWVGAGLLLLALGLVGVLVAIRLRKSGRIGRDSGEQP